MVATTDPQVTALMPVREYHPAFLGRALASMLHQTSPSWRLLVVVDEPPDVRLSAVLSPVLGDDRVRVIVNEGSGLAGAINTGMRHATTVYTGILLGDDMWAPEAVEVLTEHCLRSPEVDFFHSSRLIVDSGDRPISPIYRARTDFTSRDFLRASPVKHLLCWRRAAGLEIGGLDERSNSVGPDDYDFPWSMAEAGYRFEAIPDCLYLYRDHRDSFRLTTHLPRTAHAHELRRIFRKHRIGRLRTELTVLRARVTYLRQCLYRSPLDRWLKQRLGFDPRRGRRERYR